MGKVSSDLNFPRGAWRVGGAIFRPLFHPQSRFISSGHFIPVSCVAPVLQTPSSTCSRNLRSRFCKIRRHLHREKLVPEVVLDSQPLRASTHASLTALRTCSRPSRDHSTILKRHLEYISFLRIILFRKKKSPSFPQILKLVMCLYSAIVI